MGCSQDELADGEAIIDETGEEVLFDALGEPPEIITGGDIISDRRSKVYVNGVNVAILNERIQYMDDNGKLMTVNMKDYTREKVREQYQSLNDFLTKWHNADKKQAIIDELTEQGIVLENLKEAIDKEMDIFDMICYTAFDQPPLTRAERAKQVKKRDVFTQYGEQARKVLEALLDKYADEGIENIEDIKVLKVNPFDQFGTPTEIIKLFGGKQDYLQALSLLEKALYQAA
ncbi:hypothetical protein NG791_23475 [Laspinema sp. D1]|uniref:type I restriction-modification enzyme R subunit C-terminal domain-containing protein n=1 Tax=Laspinema palackyanum TaxID=3231601 RepID=UPI00348AF71E|nr:hypothetical protein [Laspinema sp. D2b]